MGTSKHMYITQTQQLTSSATFTLSQKRNFLVENNTSARLPPDCRPIAATPNLFLFWHDTEVAMGTSTCIWLKHINLRPVLPLHWVKKGIWWKITLPPTSARLQPDCPIAARLPPHPFFSFFDTIQRLQWVQWVLARIYDSKTIAYIHFHPYIESRKEFGGKYH